MTTDTRGPSETPANRLSSPGQSLDAVECGSGRASATCRCAIANLLSRSSGIAWWNPSSVTLRRCKIRDKGRRNRPARAEKAHYTDFENGRTATVYGSYIGAVCLRARLLCRRVGYRTHGNRPTGMLAAIPTQPAASPMGDDRREAIRLRQELADAKRDHAERDCRALTAVRLSQDKRTSLMALLTAH